MEPSPRHVTITQASEEHMDFIVPLFMAYSAFYGQSPAPDRARAYIEDGLARGESVIFLAWRGRGIPDTRSPASVEPDEAVGFAQLHPSRSSAFLTRRWILNDLFVLPVARRIGVGATLLEHIREFALESGAKDIWLRTACDNVPAQVLYESQGWRRDDGFVSYRLTLDQRGD